MAPGLEHPAGWYGPTPTIEPIQVNAEDVVYTGNHVDAVHPSATLMDEKVPHNGGTLMWCLVGAFAIILILVAASVYWLLPSLTFWIDE